MLEFYQAYANYLDLMDIGEEILNGLGEGYRWVGGNRVGANTRFFWRRPFKRMTMLEAIEAHGGPTQADAKDFKKSGEALEALGYKIEEG